MRLLSLFLAATVALPGTATAQAAAAMPEGYRDVIVRKLTVERNLLLQMADSMPERLYRDKVTPIQRDFAQQLHHVTLALTYFGPRLMGVAAPTIPDTATALNSRAGLRNLITATYDWAEATVRAQSPQDLTTRVEFFGQQIPRWQVWDELHQHSIWTAGQVVANFRKHGMAPPGFTFF